MQLTPNQKDAATILDRNLVVTAGAGSGKTRVLVTRYMNILQEQQAELNQIVAITFTKKAAMEMKQRIRREVDRFLHIAVDKGDVDQANYWQGIKANIESARISTIHSLGLQILRENPVQAGIDPGSGLIDEVQGKVMLKEIISSKVLDMAETSTPCQRIIEDCGFTTMVELVHNLYQSIKLTGMSWRQVAEKTAKRGTDVHKQLEFIRHEIVMLVDEIVAICRAKGGKSAFVDKWLDPAVGDHTTELGAISSVRTREYVALMSIFQALSTRPVKEAASHVKELKEKIEVWSQLLAEKNANPLANFLVLLTQQIDADYKQLKIRNHWLDFTDLEVGLVNLLADHPNVSRKYQKQFKFILVDEFQDTNSLQQAIIGHLSPSQSKGLFLVGDAKQSIYRFRGAEVGGFTTKAQGLTQSSTEGALINLEQNFRSDKVLIDFFNAFFGSLFTAQDGITYEAVEHFRTDYEPHRVELLLQPLVEDTRAADLRLQEARLIAQRIGALEGSLQVKDSTGFRQVRYGDFALLFRALSDIKLYERELAQRGIPYIVVGGRGFFAKQEIRDCLNLLSYLHNTQDVVALAGILRSPLFGLSDEALFVLQTQRKMYCLGLAQGLADDDALIWGQARTALHQWQLVARQLGPTAVLRHCLETSHYQAILLTVDAYGLQAWANIEQLLNIMQYIEQQGARTLTEVLEYLAVLAEDEHSTSEGPIALEGDNSVKLMTIHQSKGLEFPVVIVPDCGRANKVNWYYSVFDTNQGVIYRGKDYADNLVSTQAYQSFMDAEKLFDFSEYKRLFYVAATRAQEYLIFSGWSKSGWPKSGWQKKIKDKGYEQGTSWLDWVFHFLGMESWPAESQETDAHIKVVVTAPQQPGPKTKQVNQKLPDQEQGINLQQPLNAPGLPKVSVAASSLRDYQRCQRLFYFRHWLRLPEPQHQTQDKSSADTRVDPLVLGNVVHRVCENLLQSEKLDSVLGEALNWENIPSTLRLAYQKQALPMLLSYVQSELWQQVTVGRVRSELQSRVQIDNVTVSGIIDKLITLPDGYTIIVDYKTDNISKEDVPQVAAGYTAQLATYALAVHRVTGIAPRHLYLYFLRPGVLYDVGDNIDKQQGLTAYLQEHLKNLTNSITTNSWPRNEGVCHQCNYPSLCAESLNGHSDT